MASVQEIKDQLLQEREELAELTQRSLDVVDKTLNISTYTLTGIGIAIAIFSLVGVLAVWQSARVSAKKIANNRLDTYIESDVFATLLEQKVSEAVERRLQSAVLVRGLDTDGPVTGDPSEFPSPNGRTPT